MKARLLWKGVHLVQALFTQAPGKVTWVPELEGMPELGGVSQLVEDVIIGRGCHNRWRVSQLDVSILIHI